MNTTFSHEAITEALNQSVCETLENLAFTEVMVAPDTSLNLKPVQCLGTRISLGNLGTMDLVLEKNFLEEIGGILFNAGPEGLEPDALPDTLNEILNIIAGRFLEKLFQGQSDFTMGLPEPHFDLKEWNTLPIRWVFNNDTGTALAFGVKQL